MTTNMTTNEYQWISMQWLHSGYILTTSDYILAHSGALKYMPKYGQIRFLGPRIWVLKRSCEMQFRSVYLRPIVMTKFHFCPISPLQLLGGLGGGWGRQPSRPLAMLLQNPGLFGFCHLMHEMISAKKSPTKMEIKKASFVTLVLLCIAPIRTSKYPGRSIWRRNKNCDYFRIDVTIRKMRRPSGARTTTPIHNCSSILVRPD